MKLTSQIWFASSRGSALQLGLELPVNMLGQRFALPVEAGNIQIEL